jgi:hypothetical protein
MCAALQAVHIVDSDTSSLSSIRANSRVNQAQRVWGRDLNAAGGSSTDKIPPRHYNGSGQGVRRRLHAVRKLGTLHGGSNHFHIAGASLAPAPLLHRITTSFTAVSPPPLWHTQATSWLTHAMTPHRAAIQCCIRWPSGSRRAASPPASCGRRLLLRRCLWQRRHAGSAKRGNSELQWLGPTVLPYYYR